MTDTSMAEIVGTASALPASISSALLSSKTLLTLIETLRNAAKMELLRIEIQTLVEVLESLQKSTSQNCLDMPSLQIPLLRCGKACAAFSAEIKRCCSDAENPRLSFRIWMKYSYMNKDILEFASLVAGYRATFAIALVHASMYG